MIDFDAASLLLQWAAGGLLFLWVTTRRREVSLGYGWLMRGTYLLMAVRARLPGNFAIQSLAGPLVASLEQGAPSRSPLARAPLVPC